MDVHFQVDASGFNAACAGWISTVGEDVRLLFRYQMQKLVSTLDHYTFPRSKAQGEHAVDRDIRKAVSPTDREYFKGITDDRIRTRLQHLSDSGNTPAMLVVLKKFRSVIPVPFSLELHTSQRNSRGRVSHRTGRITTDVRAEQEYIRKVQSRVGLARGGWNAFAAMFGETHPAFVSRHGMSGGSAVGDLESISPWVEAENHVVWMPGYQESVDAALLSRERAMTIDTHRMLAGGAQRSGFMVIED
jgi:hypothetical protein